MAGQALLLRLRQMRRHSRFLGVELGEQRLDGRAPGRVSSTITIRPSFASLRLVT